MSEGMKNEVHSARLCLLAKRAAHPPPSQPRPVPCPAARWRGREKDKRELRGCLEFVAVGAVRGRQMKPWKRSSRFRTVPGMRKPSSSVGFGFVMGGPTVGTLGASSPISLAP